MKWFKRNSIPTEAAEDPAVVAEVTRLRDGLSVLPAEPVEFYRQVYTTGPPEGCEGHGYGFWVGAATGPWGDPAIYITGNSEEDAAEKLEQAIQAFARACGWPQG